MSGLTGFWLSQVVKELYQLIPNVRMEAQTGQQSSFDAVYTRDTTELSTSRW